MTITSRYQEHIAATLESRYGSLVNELDPSIARWIEAHMRTELDGTLDDLGGAAWDSAVLDALREAARTPTATNDALARTWGIA